MNFKLLLKDRVLRTSNTKHDGMLIPSTLQGTQDECGISDLWIKDDFDTSSQQLMQKDKLFLKEAKLPLFFSFTDTDV